MTAPRRTLALVVSLLGVLLVPAGAGAATERPVVLLIHGGAWLFGKPADLDQAAQIAQRLGMQPVRVDYPLGDIVAANRAVREAALAWRHRGRTVLAYGESVGGTMAELLAAQCRVALAVGNSSPPDLVRWPQGDNAILWAYLGGGDLKTRRRYSPALRQQCNPVLAEHSPADTVVGFRFAAAYARKFPATVGLVRTPGGHVGPPRARNIGIGLRWLVRKDGLGYYGPPLASPVPRR